MWRTLDPSGRATIQSPLGPMTAPLSFGPSNVPPRTGTTTRFTPMGPTLFAGPLSNTRSSRNSDCRLSSPAVRPCARAARVFALTSLVVTTLSAMAPTIRTGATAVPAAAMKNFAKPRLVIRYLILTPIIVPSAALLRLFRQVQVLLPEYSKTTRLSLARRLVAEVSRSPVSEELPGLPVSASSGREDQIAGQKLPPRCSIIENALATRDDINLVARVGRSRIATRGAYTLTCRLPCSNSGANCTPYTVSNFRSPSVTLK